LAESGGRTEQARPLLEESLALNKKLGRAEGVAWGLEGLAMAAGASGQPLRAARLFGAAEAMRVAFSLQLPEQARALLQRSVQAARPQASPTEWDMAWAEGRAMPPQQAAEYALGREA
jgi:hypothetical protein